MLYVSSATVRALIVGPNGNHGQGPSPWAKKKVTAALHQTELEVPNEITVLGL